MKDSMPQRPRRSTQPAGGRLASALAAIDRHHQLIDGALSRPARWHGPIRRELVGRDGDAERRRVAACFDWLARTVSPASSALDRELIIELHDRAVGGRALRRTAMRVGVFHEFPQPEEVEERLDVLLAFPRAAEPAALQAARVHLGLLSIHGFSDGNGRTARLAATYIQLRAGFRSTLFTVVDQHFAHDPDGYVRSLDRLRFGVIPEDGCLADLLEAMAYRSAWAAWFVGREKRLKAAFAHLDPIEREFAMARFDLDVDGGRRSDLLPWHALRSRLGPRAQRDLRAQVERLVHEQEC